MDTLAARPLNVLTAADVRTPRDATEGNAELTSGFEEALGNELALMMPDAATAAELLTTATQSVAPDSAGMPTDGTQMLEAILDSASMLPPSVASTPAVRIESFDGLEDVRRESQSAFTTPAPQASFALVTADTPALVRAATAPALPAPFTAPDAKLLPDEANAEVDKSALMPAPALSGTAPESTAAEAAETKALAATAMPAAATLQAASGNRVTTPEALTSTQKSAVPGAKAATLATAALTTTETRENREAVAPQPRADRLGAPLEAGLERRQTDALISAAGMERFAPPELSVQTNDVTSSLDAFSSAALISKWTPAPHSGPLATSSAPVTARIDTPLGADGWSDAFRQKIVWLVDRQQQSAELHVNPPHLGPVEVVLNLGEDGARIAFCSPHASVREAIEASLAELRTALAERGLALGQALVSADPGSAREQLKEENAQGTQRGERGGAESVAPTQTELPKPPRRGLVDIFA